MPHTELVAKSAVTFCADTVVPIVSLKVPSELITLYSAGTFSVTSREIEALPFFFEKGEYMRLAIMILFCVCFLLLLEKPLKKYSTVFYIATVFLAGAGYMVQTRMQPGLARTILADYLTSGTLSAALFVIVMYAIVLPKKTRIFLCTMSLRGEIAILASVLGLTHIVYYGHSLGKRTGRTDGMMSGTERVTLVIALLIIFLLVPLTVTSFKWVRRKMNGKRWKKLQK